MSVTARGLLVALPLTLVLAASAALAQSSASGDASRPWTDPPTRGATGPASDATKPGAAKRSDTASAPGSAIDAARTTPSSAGRGQRSAGVRRERIRQAATQARVRRDAFAAMRRDRRRELAYAGRPGSSPPPLRSPGRRYPPEYARDEFGDPVPFGRRRSGWGELLSENPASRAAEARDAGFAIGYLPRYQRGLVPSLPGDPYVGEDD